MKLADLVFIIRLITGLLLNITQIMATQENITDNI